MKPQKINPKAEKHPIAIGYWFSEQTPFFPDPHSFVKNEIDQQLRQLVAAYLDRGTHFIPYLGHSWCRFKCGAKEDEMGSFCFTDGDYIWPQGLGHYIKRHNVWLPELFIEHVVRNNTRDISHVDTSILDLHDYNWWIDSSKK